VGPRLARALAHHELPCGGALTPVDIARVFPIAHHLEAEEILPVPSPDDPVTARGSAWRCLRELHRVDARIDDELPVRRHFTGLLEEPERKPRRDPKADVTVAPALRRRSAIRRDLGGFGADLQEE